MHNNNCCVYDLTTCGHMNLFSGVHSVLLLEVAVRQCGALRIIVLFSKDVS